MSRFDEEPDGDPHGECAAEINRLNALLALQKASYERELADARDDAIEQCAAKFDPMPDQQVGTSGYVASVLRSMKKGTP